MPSGGGGQRGRGYVRAVLWRWLARGAIWVVLARFGLRRRRVRRARLLVYEAGVRACCEEDPRDIEVAHPARTQESRVAIVVYHVHARAVLQQECHHVRVALLTRAVKRWEVHSTVLFSAATLFASQSHVKNHHSHCGTSPQSAPHLSYSMYRRIVTPSM